MTARQYKHHVRGKKAKESGDRGENAVIESLKGYMAQNWLSAEKTFPETKMIKGELQYTGKGAADFTCVVSPDLLLPGGIALQFDVKNTKDTLNTVLLGRIHQYLALRRCHRMKGVAGYLVRWFAKGNTRRETINEWRWHDISTVTTEWRTRKGKLVEMVRINRSDGTKVPVFNQQLGFFDIEEEVAQPDFLVAAIKQRKEELTLETS